MELRHDSIQCPRRVLLQAWLPKVTGSGFHYTIAIVIVEIPPKCNHTLMETHTVPGQIGDVYTNSSLMTGSVMMEWQQTGQSHPMTHTVRSGHKSDLMEGEQETGIFSRSDSFHS